MQSEKELTPNQKNLVNLMTTMVQKYYRAANLSSEKTELPLISKPSMMMLEHNRETNQVKT